MSENAISENAISENAIASISTLAMPQWGISKTFSPDGINQSINTNSMELGTFVELLEQVSQDTGRTGWAWDTGLSTDYSTRGRVGRVVLGASSLRAAFKRLCEYFPLIQDSTDLRLTVGPQWSELTYKILDPDIWPRTQDALYSLGIYAALIKSAAPDAWGQVDVTIEAKPEQIRTNLSSIIEANVNYNGDFNGIRFPTSLLDCKLNYSTRAFASDIENLNRDLISKRRNMPMSIRVRQRIYRDLGEKSVNQELVARDLGVCSRTLRRRLTNEQTSFQVLLDDCRMRVAALDFKTKRPFSISELALRLGYSEHSSFTRAFSRWAGMSPQAYRDRFCPLRECPLQRRRFKA